MKKRRGGKRGVKAIISFCSVEPREMKPKLTFSFMNKNSRHFEMAIEKIEYLVDVIPLQLQTFQQKGNVVDEILYTYDEDSFKWNPHMTKTQDGSKYFYFQQTREWIQKP
jgi:prolyl oligopeptidase PreP (S9A serine peptidase family)